MESIINHYNEREAYERAQKKAREIKGFYINLLCYCLVIPMLIYINLTYSPEVQWFWFSAIGWGTGLTFHGISAFGRVPFLGKDWEERKVREILEKEKNKGN